MIPLLVFPVLAALLVYQAGRRDAARDPRLTAALLFLLAILPLLSAFLPKVAVFDAVSAAGASESSFPWIKWIIAVWAAGFLIQLARIAAAMVALKRWKNESSEMERIAGVSIRESVRVNGPVAAGILSPVIFVPTGWHTWPEESRKVAIEHELAHHRRRDPLWRLLAAIARAIHWYHPLVHWMSRRFIEQCEFACDSIVLEKGISAKTYARVLCDFADGRSQSPLAVAMAEQGSLEGRIVRILKPAAGGGTMPLVVLGLMGTMAACSLSMIGRAANDPQPVPAKEIELRFSANPFPANP